MLKRIIFFFISATILVALYGCHAGGNSPLAPNNAETVVSPEIRIVNDKGRFDDITFPSGAVIKCPNENTFKEGVRVTAAEQKVPVITDNSGKFSYIYVYNISAVMPSENSLTADVPVNTIEKPLKVSFPNNSTTGICYIGTRESESDPWRYTLADDGGVGNLRYSRLSVRSPKVCYFDIYRLNIQFRLFVFDNEDSDKAEVDFVDVSTGSKDNKISIENGKYTEDLEIKISLYGEKLDSINVDNLTARIIYRSKSLSPVQLKANGSIVKQNDSDDKAVTGGYEHSFEINNIKIDSSMSGEAVLSFVLNLNGISLEDFPTDFLVEFYSDTKVEKAIPFIYSQAFSFETKENQEEPEPGPGPEPGPEPGPLVTYSIAYDLDGGEPTGDNPTSYTAENEITLSNPKKEGYTFTGWTGTDLDNPTTKVTIAKGSTGDRSYKANWQQNAPDEYTLTLVAGTGIASVDDSKAYKADESIELNYTLKDGYEFDKWYDSDDNAVTSPFTMPAKAVTLTANAKPILYNITYTDIENCTFTADNPTTYTVETADFELPKPAKDYYSFVGWVLNGGEPVETVTITKGTHENRTYKAKFTPATYTITLDPNDGTVEYTTKEYNVETADFTLPKAAKDYYSFDGWVLNGDEPVETVTITKGTHENRTYKAKFTPATYTITLDPNDGTVEYTTKEYNVETAEFTLPTPTRTGHEFLGWLLEGETTPVKTVKIAKGSTTGDKTYTAKWNLNLTLAIAQDDGAILDDANNPPLYYTKATFTMTPTLAAGTVMSDSEKADILSAISVKDTAGTSFENATATWNNDGKIALSFLKDLTASTTFTISFGEIDGVNLTCEPKTFKTFYFKGKGSTDNRYQIESAEQLDYVRNYLDKHYVQTADIDLGTYTDNWKAIGSERDENMNYIPFIGSYYGNGKLIKNLTIHSSNNSGSFGLFGYVGDIGKTAEIASITIDGVSIRGANANESIGGGVGIIANTLCGADSSIKNCVVTNSSGNNSEIIGSTISGICCGIYVGNNIKIENCTVEKCVFKSSTAGESVHIAGICGNAGYLATIDSCHVENVNISCENFSSAHVGGICCANPKTVKNCSVKNTSIICKTTSDNSEIEIGGICKDMPETLDGCSVSNTTIKVESTSSSILRVGGISCYQNYPGGTLKNSYVENSVLTASGTQGCIGGIAAFGDQGSIDSCYIKGTNVYGQDLDSDSNYFYVGGIIGDGGDSNTIKNCYSTNSTVNGTGYWTYVGGICGESGNENSITSCYVTGSSISGDGYVGGICGDNESGSISSCYVTGSSSISSEDNSSQIGGICGYYYGSEALDNCYIDNSSVTSLGESSYLGGICGYQTAGITSCYVNKTVVSGKYCIGGICGYLEYQASSCHVDESTVSGEGDDIYVAGLFGNIYSDAEIENCYLLKSSVSSTGKAYIGGIGGYAIDDLCISTSYVKDSTIEAKNGNESWIGGILGIGYDDCSITSSYVQDSSVINNGGNECNIGGFGGYIGNRSILSACYLYESDDNHYIRSNGSSCSLGYLLGLTDYSETKVSDCFTNLNESALVGTNSGIIEKSYLNVNDKDTFTGKEWTSGAWSGYSTSSFPPTLNQN